MEAEVQKYYPTSFRFFQKDYENLMNLTERVNEVSNKERSRSIVIRALLELAATIDLKKLNKTILTMI